MTKVDDGGGGEEGSKADGNATDPSTATATKRGSIRKDLRTIGFLMYMYFLQGIVLGLCGAVPLILGARKIGFAAQGTFSFASWPFSIKLLWAPLVDSFFLTKIGRRRSWIIPVNFTIGVFMFSFAHIAKNLLDNSQTQAEILSLAVIFFLMTFLVATQDVVVDGWAISLLSKKNVHWQAICNGTGQTSGYYVGNICFVILESAKFCNSYVRPLFGLASQDHGIITLEIFMYIFGAVFLATSVVIFFFKNEHSKNNLEEIEKDEHDKSAEAQKLSLFHAYKVIWNLLKLKTVRRLVLVFLTVSIGSAADGVFSLKLIEFGVSKEKISMFALPLGTISMVWPIILSKHTANANPFMMFFKITTVKIFYLIVAVVFVSITLSFRDSNGDFPISYFAIYILYMIGSQLIGSTCFLAIGSILSNVADPAIGGTYMTLLATVVNLGSMYPSTAALYLIGFFTVKACVPKTTDSSSNFTLVFSSFNETVSAMMIQNKCSTPALSEECSKIEGVCVTTTDAYYIVAGVFIVIGIVWLALFYKFIRKLSQLPKSDWKLE